MLDTPSITPKATIMYHCWHLLFDYHQEIDELRDAELANSFIGTTKRGIGPCYSSKVIRNGIRVSDFKAYGYLPG
ncbi:putative adenylosuccinate synthase [Helianthus annuus]|nr:putative adenylosuccinate synthase [Helianthus annuus]